MNKLVAPVDRGLSSPLHLQSFSEPGFRKFAGARRAVHARNAAAFAIDSLAAIWAQNGMRRLLGLQVLAPRRLSLIVFLALAKQRVDVVKYP